MICKAAVFDFGTTNTVYDMITVFLRHPISLQAEKKDRSFNRPGRPLTKLLWFPPSDSIDDETAWKWKR